MLFRYLKNSVEAVLSFLRNQSGSIMIYTGAFMAIGVGGAALSIDIGRIVLLKTQMQNRADAGALAGAAQLDAQPGAIERAGLVMTDAMTAYTTAAADQGELAVWFTEFHAAAEDAISKGAITTDDNAARFATIVMERRTLSFFYGPALNLLTGKGADSETFLDARAVGMSDPFICKMQPLMICNPFDNGDGTVSDVLGDNPGIGVRIKQSPSSGTWQPGNFGLLDLPEDANYGAGGANAVQAALEAEDPLGCYAVSTLDTQPGNMVMKVKDGINVRWEGPNVAPNVKNYPHDRVMDPSDALYDSSLNWGDGVWDLANYWSTHHNGVAMPAILAGASRYEVYLFEQDVNYYKKGTKNVKFALTAEELSGGGWTYVQPADDYPAAAVIPSNATYPDDNDLDGVPPSGETISSKGYARRNITIAVANCVSESFSGNASIPADGIYVELFLYTQATEPGSDGAEIYGEVIRAIEARTSLEFHGNVRLVE